MNTWLMQQTTVSSAILILAAGFAFYLLLSKTFGRLRQAMIRRYMEKHDMDHMRAESKAEFEAIQREQYEKLRKKFEGK